MTEVIDGQLSIFDWMEDFDPAKEATPAAGYPALDDIPEEKAIKIIGDRIGVNFTWNSFFERYEAKVGKITLDACYDHYLPEIKDGRLMLSIGYSGKHFGGGKPSDSIEEAIDYFEKYVSEKDMTVRSPCGRRCKYEWGSKQCFESRGQIYDYHERKWLRDEEGRPVIGKKTCDWEPGKGK